MDRSPPGSSVRGISQERILEWAAISSFRGSSHPRINLRLLHWQVDSLPSEPPGKPEMGITVLIFHKRTLRLRECNLLKNHRALSVEAAVQHRRLGSVLRRNDGWGGAEGEGGLFSSLLGSSEDELSLYTFISPVPGLKISKSQTNSEALEKYLLC